MAHTRLRYDGAISHFFFTFCRPIAGSYVHETKTRAGVGEGKA